MKTLAKIQKELKAPKGQTNNFGGYKYRSAEDILEALKPLLGEAVLTIDDEVIQIGDRFYVKASATISLDGESVTVRGWAREPQDKKGADAAQITGATSSYARKYALNGLFAIDDTKDADHTNDHGKGQQKQAAAKPADKPAPKPAAKQDPRVTVAKRIEADKEAKWFEVIPFAKGPQKGLTLGDIVAAGDPAPIKQVLEYIDPVALEHELAVQRLKDALAELNSTLESVKGTPAEPGKDEVPGF